MKWLLTIALILSSTTQYPAKVTAQTPQPATPKQPVQPVPTPATSQKPTSRPVFVLPKIPPRLGTVSGRRAGMGSRDNCPVVTTALTALVPLQAEQKQRNQTDKSDIGIVEGLTTAQRPTFWFYVPYTQDLPNASAEFILQDSAGEDIYKHAIALPPKPSVVGVSLPETVTALEVGKTYHWYFKVRCQQQTASVPVYVEGDIKRINLDSRVMQQLESTTDPQSKIVIYAKEGIWFDAVTLLAQLRLANDNDASIKEDWQSLLQSVNLNNIATAPILKTEK
ncbi:hypothetical protein NIES2100_18090 [Calothrix sp. NIES-2100]|uniref:DUF928 domain-containing protein n=1 Tax=Calothrix sp. NIES-2100 TaxID=1954172 RepID=UPI000B60B001|nr:hypothetical protein NIES2100_18090 [Calothrix sp. NIES-2100]